MLGILPLPGSSVDEWGLVDGVEERACDAVEFQAHALWDIKVSAQQSCDGDVLIDAEQSMYGAHTYGDYSVPDTVQ